MVYSHPLWPSPHIHHKVLRPRLQDTEGPIVEGLQWSSMAVMANENILGGRQVVGHIGLGEAMARCGNWSKGIGNALGPRLMRGDRPWCHGVSLGTRRGWPYTSSADEACRSSLGAERRPSITQGRRSAQVAFRSR